MKGEFAGINDFEVVAFLVVLPEAARMNAADAHRRPRPARRQPAWTSACPRSCCSRTARPPPPTSASINDGIEELLWLAALKPTTIGVPDYRDDVREYLEIAVLRRHAAGRGQGDPARRADPPRHSLSGRCSWPRTASALSLSAGPQALVAGRGGQDGAGWRRRSPSTGMRRRRADIVPPSATRWRSASQPRATLFALYQGWIDTLLALQAARRDRRLCRRRPTPNTPRPGARRCENARGWMREIARLRAAAAKEKQMAAAGGTEPGTQARGGRPGRRSRKTMKERGHDEEADRRTTPKPSPPTSSPRTSSSSRRSSPKPFTEGQGSTSTCSSSCWAATVDEREEKYGLNWHGKRRARQLALTPSTGTLRPCPEDSVDWDTTQNLMIEGDNLEVLKLLQKSYAGKVKLIYIDPPYNTGKDFVYPDNFQDNIKNYLELTGQVEGGRKISSNTEASGRFHTDWLNMMYPRLKLARNLLRDDGVIFVIIDDTEASQPAQRLRRSLRRREFRRAMFWKRYIAEQPRQVIVAVNHDYILVVCEKRTVARIASASQQRKT